MEIKQRVSEIESPVEIKKTSDADSYRCICDFLRMGGIVANSDLTTTLITFTLNMISAIVGT